MTSPTYAICGTVCECGPNGEPLACGFPHGHKGNHAWATLPTYTQGGSRSIADQLQGLHALAIERGMYDAAGWLAKWWAVEEGVTV